MVDAEGGLISETYWRERRNNHSDLLTLMLTNSITGAASLFRRELLDYALPFPPAQFAHFHDHWIGVTALALGDIAYINRPLYDYVQHRESVLGHSAANQGAGARVGTASLLHGPREVLAIWRGQYFTDACRLMQFAAVLEMRCGQRMTPAKRRSLAAFLDADHSLRPLLTLGRRAIKERVGSPQTLGAERMLMRAFGWRHVLAASVRLPPRARPGATPPLTLTPTHERDDQQGSRIVETARAIADKIAPLYLAVRDDAPERVNILIPTIDLEHFFGGYIAKFNLARRLAERGVRTRVVTVDPVEALPDSWASQLESYSNLTGFFEKVEVTFAREQGLEVSPSDRFIATTWWTAHIAHSALTALERDRFVYLIQEYEPLTFPMGTYAALAGESYSFPHFALFSGELLRDYFRRHGIGVYGQGVEAGDAASASFQNAITAIDPPTRAELSARTTRSLLFYARPESHASRNMFELGVLALRDAVDAGALRPPWELNGIGSLDGGQEVVLGNGAVLRLAAAQRAAHICGEAS